MRAPHTARKKVTSANSSAGLQTCAVGRYILRCCRNYLITETPSRFGKCLLQLIINRNIIWKHNHNLAETARSQDCAATANEVIRGKTRSMPLHRRGTEKSAEDLVGPPEWMESERRSTAVVRGVYKPTRGSRNMECQAELCHTNASVLARDLDTKYER